MERRTPSATLTSKGQTTIPRQVREHPGLRPGDRLRLGIEKSGRVVLEVATIPIRYLRGIFPGARPGGHARRNQRGGAGAGRGTAPARLIGVDTNALVRYLVEDDLEQAEEAAHFEVLKGVSVTAHKGDVITILDASGSGKSTFLRCINLLEQPDRGRIVVAGEEVRAASADGSHRPRFPEHDSPSHP